MNTHADIFLGLVNFVKNIDPSMPLMIRGVPLPSYENVDEWVSFEILSIMEGAARRHTVEQMVDIQIICYSRHATHRKDNDFSAIYKLMAKYGDPFHRKDILIKNTCIQFKENKIVPLDLRSVGDYAKDILNSLPPLHTLSTVILNQGLISSTTA